MRGAGKLALLLGQTVFSFFVFSLPSQSMNCQNPATLSVQNETTPRKIGTLPRKFLRTETFTVVLRTASVFFSKDVHLDDGEFNVYTDGEAELDCKVPTAKSKEQRAKSKALWPSPFAT
jgi:hypothetical protein